MNDYKDESVWLMLGDCLERMNSMRRKILRKLSRYIDKLYRKDSSEGGGR